jgi:CO dehydrogenase/acetyl-CoA synthase alpha subunit
MLDELNERNILKLIFIVRFACATLDETTTDEFHIFAEKLMSDALLPFAKTNFNMMSARKQCSLYQELHRVAPLSRRVILSLKKEMKAMIGRTAVDPTEQHLGALLDQPRILSEELKLPVVQVWEAADVPYEGAHALNQSTKREVLEWIGEN